MGKREKFQDVQYIIEMKQIYSFKNYSCHIYLKILRLRLGGLPKIKNEILQDEIYSAIEERII